MPDTMLHLGMDVHKEFITLAVLSGDASTATWVDRLPNDHAKLR